MGFYACLSHATTCHATGIARFLSSTLTVKIIQRLRMGVVSIATS